MKISIFVFIIHMILFQSAFSQNEDMASDASINSVFVVCHRQKETRWLRAFKLDNGRCKTYYSKEGYVQVVSSASYFSSCAAVMNTVKKNIEEGGFKCAEKNLASMLELE
jgi:hypothetical protein